ncbi:acyltransferase family protein [Tunturiibacter lichenicola]|uniref:acyltransferase family protein n=1 Tax=Tunturiibacter lichenicola TaxID=2051959 RepID=UPI0021B3B6C7|nr:acyltransferase [Edaphobacter lichenicola]
MSEASNAISPTDAQHAEVALSRQSFWRSLRRVTASGRYIPQIDGLRFIAIVAVIVYHIGQLSWMNCNFCASQEFGLAGIISHLDRGVPLFFTISGFILGLPFANEHLLEGRKVNIRHYFLRRVTRLEPPYILNLLIRFPMIAGVKHVSWGVASAHLLASLFYMHGAIYGTLPMVHIPSWSLEVEVQFYLMAPILAAVFFPRKSWMRRSSLVLAIIGFIILRSVTPGDLQTRLHLSIISFAQYFLVGFLMSDWFLTAAKRMKQSWLWDLVGVGALFAMVMITEVHAYFLLPLLIMAVLAAAFQGVLFSQLLAVPFVATLGGMCYSLYLTHSLVLQFCAWVIIHQDLAGLTYLTRFIAYLLASVPVILAVGITFFVLIERPCMDQNWPSKLWSRLTKKSTPVLS